MMYETPDSPLVRYATEGDIPRIIELGREEHAASPWRDTPYDARAVEGTARAFMLQPGRTLMVTRGGYLGGMVQALGFSPKRIALEYAWYANDGRGMQLLRAFERWANRMGASAVVVHDYAGAGRLSSVLTKRGGWEATGMALTKRLEK